MSHQVRTHTRRAGGKTVTVRHHVRDGALTEQEQAKRDRFERRVERERRGNVRIPGVRKRKKRGPRPERAKRHARKALRLWRRHKVKALCYAGLAAGEITAWAVMAGVSKLRGKKKGGRKR